MAACALACATIVGCFGGPGLEPPGEDTRGVGGPPIDMMGGGGVVGDMTGAVNAETGGSAAPEPPFTGGVSGAGTEGGTVAPPTDAGDGGLDAGADAGGDAHVGGLSCAEIETEFDAELARVQDCSAGEACTHTPLNAGCIGTSNSGLLPLCGLVHREGADFGALLELDEAYGAGACYKGPLVCAGCAEPAVSCVAGRCTQDAPNGA